MSDTKWDFIHDKIEEEKLDRFLWHRDYCHEDCDGHDENCPYYDADEETWDFEQCFRDND